MTTFRDRGRVKIRVRVEVKVRVEFKVRVRGMISKIPKFFIFYGEKSGYPTFHHVNFALVALFLLAMYDGGSTSQDLRSKSQADMPTAAVLDHYILNQEKYA